MLNFFVLGSTEENEFCILDHQMVHRNREAQWEILTFMQTGGITCGNWSYYNLLISESMEKYKKRL